MARSIVLLAAAVILAGVLVAPSNAQTPTDAAIQQQIQQIINGVVTQINYCVSNVSVPTACPAMAPLFTALNISAKLQESFLSSDSPSGAPAPAPASPFAACFNTLSPDSFLYGINPALVLPLCNNTKCATASAQVDTCITGVIDNVAGPSFGDSPAAAPSPSDPGEGSNSPDVPGAIAQFCTSPVCVSEAKAATPPPPPPAGSAATVRMSVLAVATLSMIVVGAAL